MINDNYNAYTIPTQFESTGVHAKKKVAELVCAALIPPEPIDWLWPDWLPIGKFITLAGAPGTGKTNIAMEIVATTSNGGLGPGRSTWPDNTFSAQGNVVIWSGEDGIADTLTPRLIAAKANLNRIHMLTGTRENGRSRPFDFTKDIHQLREAIMELGGVRLVVIDSIVQAVAGDSNKNSAVRKALDPLVELAQEHNCAILGITHLTKNSKGKSPLDRVSGSLAFGAVARVVLLTAKISAGENGDESPGCVLVRAKSNIGPDHGGFMYQIQKATISAGHRPIETSKVVWKGPLQGSAKEILDWAEGDDSAGAGGAVENAIAFLRGHLASNVELRVTEIESLAAAAGISSSSLKRAKKELGVKSKKIADNWWCSLEQSSSAAVAQNVSDHFGSDASAQYFPHNEVQFNDPPLGPLGPLGPLAPLAPLAPDAPDAPDALFSPVPWITSLSSDAQLKIWESCKIQSQELRRRFMNELSPEIDLDMYPDEYSDAIKKIVETVLADHFVDVSSTNAHVEHQIRTKLYDYLATLS